MWTSGVLWTVVGCLSPAPPNINLALGPGSHTAMGGPRWSQQTNPSGNRKIPPTLAVLSGLPQWGVEQAYERGFEAWPGQALEQGPGHPSTSKYLQATLLFEERDLYLLAMGGVLLSSAFCLPGSW